MQVPAGVLLDRLGVSMSAGSAASSLAAPASKPRSLPGSLDSAPPAFCSASPTFPSNAKAIGYWFTTRERTLATAITDAAAKFSTGIGVPFLGVLLLRFGWRWSFATGFISLFYFALFYCVYRNPSEDSGLSPSERQHILAGGAQPEDLRREARRNLDREDRLAPPRLSRIHSASA